MQEQITVKWLICRGYTVAAAARKIKLSRQHVNEVLAGNRSSKKVEAALRQLPKRALVLRERAAR